MVSVTAGYGSHMTETDPHTEQTTAKDPEDWTTGDEPMTGAQQSYLETLAREAGEDVPDALSKADASKLIDDLQSRTGRGA
jgi:Protein of unknown function (DUF3072)